MRNGASVSQLLAESCEPRGARMMRALSSRVGITSPSETGKGEAGVEYRPQGPLDRLGEPGVPARRVALVGEIAAQRKLHLDGVDAVGRAAIAAGDPAALEAAVDHVRPRTGRADRGNPFGERRIARFAVI